MSEVISGDAGRIGFLIKGDYDNSDVYDFLDVVYYNNSSYVAKKRTIGNIPNYNNEFWQILAKGGVTTDSMVSGVKGSEETEYRQGDVNISKTDIGLGNVENYKQARESIYGDTSVNMGRKSGTGVGELSFAFGRNVEASGARAISIGKDNIASGDNSFACGSETVASGNSSHSEGFNTKSIGNNSHAECGENSATGNNSHAEGRGTEAKGLISHSGGYGTIAKEDIQTAIGSFNVESASTNFNNPFIVGNGSDYNNRSNAFRINKSGAVYGKGEYNSSGADYAEFIREWYDGNTDNEDRVGYFVTVKDGYLYKANDGDYIIGITSGNPSVVGNSDEEYYWRWERDEFNRIIYEEVPQLAEKLDEDGTIIRDETGNPIMIETGKTMTVMKQRKDYDSSKQSTYTERKDRKEWDYVGMIGVLPVRDDGTCEVGKFCKCADGGIATMAEERGFDTYMVIERVTENIVSVILK